MPEESGTTTVARRNGWGRIASFIALGVLVVLAIAIAVLWTQRRSIATHFLKGEFERRNVQASYHLDRVGFRTQQVSNLIVGDPKRPDLTAKNALIQMRLKWDGNFQVYRVVARGVRLRGRLVHGKVSCGQIDRLLPPPSNKPFALPNIVLDIADSSISLATPFGPVGLAAEGSGRLSGGFKGRLAVASPRIVPGKCAAMNLRANLAVSVVARHPRGEGPVSLDRFACPVSRFDVVTPRFDAKVSFNESFTRVDGSGRMAITTLVAGANGLANFLGDITYKGSLEKVDGRVKLSAQKSRMATIYADRTRLNGDYHLGLSKWTFALNGDFAADSAALTTSDTSSRKPMPRTMATVTMRERMNPHTPPGCSRCGACQMVSRADCNSASTVVAPSTRSTTPMRVDTMPSLGFEALCRRPSMALAASSLTMPCSCCTTAPRAASSPKARPATEITISSSGAIENAV